MNDDFKNYKGIEARIGNYIIRTDPYNWVVEERKVKDTNHHLTSDNGKSESVGDIRYYGTFENMWQGLLEKETKRTFQRSGMEKVYSTALQNLFDLIKEAEAKLVSKD